MKAFQATNIGFGLPNCRYFKVEITSKDGPANYYKIGADNEPDAMLEAGAIAQGWLLKHGGLGKFRITEINQFSAVLSNQD